MERKEVYAIIDTERDYQDALWNADTTPSKGIHSPEEVIVYMEDYLSEAKHFMSRENQKIAYPKALVTMRKVVALGIRLMEQYGSEPRIIPPSEDITKRSGN